MLYKQQNKNVDCLFSC